MKVLLLTVTAGHGHTQAAKVIMECLENNGAQCKLLDTLEYINPILGESIDKDTFILPLTPNVYGSYTMPLITGTRPMENFPYPHNEQIIVQKTHNLLADFRPDIVVVPMCLQLRS